MSMPSYVYLVECVDRADFHRPLRRKVCKTKRAAENWGVVNVDELAEAARKRGEDVIDFDYAIRPVEYLDN